MADMLSLSNKMEMSNLVHSFNSTLSLANPNNISVISSLPDKDRYNYMVSTVNTPIPYQESIGGTTYFYPSTGEDATQQQLLISNTELMSPSPVFGAGGLDRNQLIASPHHVTATPPMGTNRSHTAPSTFCIHPALKDQLIARTLEIYSPTPQISYNGPLPVTVEHYHSLIALEGAPLGPLNKSGEIFPRGVMCGYQTSAFKAVDSRDGMVYCMHRIHGYYLTNIKIRKSLAAWKRFQHINAVQLKECFSTKSFGDSSLVFVYRYHAGTQTLMNRHFPTPWGRGKGTPLGNYNSNPRNNPGTPHYNNNGRSPPSFSDSCAQFGTSTEGDMWNLIVQISCSIRAVHSKNLWCGGLDTLKPSKILVDPFTQRIRINCLGMADILNQDSSDNFPNMASMISHHQQEDLTALGKLILALASNSLTSYLPQHTAMCLRLVAQKYSTDLKNVVIYLLNPSPPGLGGGADGTTLNANGHVIHGHPRKSINDIMPMIGARFYGHLETAYAKFDCLQDELAKEMENSRLFRLLSKLGTINEKPELNLDPSWAETGDRYLLKLFLDYLFHSTRDDGRPFVDLSHLISCLNKLDAGTSEKILLTSRDQSSVLVVSYSDLKRCLDSSFAELMRAGLD